MKKIPIREAQLGAVYFTSRGMKVELLRLRPDGEDVVVKSITSGGHEVVLPGGLMVTGEELPVDIQEASVEHDPAEYAITDLIFCIVKESQVTVDDIVNITGYSQDVVEHELEVLLQPSVN